MMAATNTVAELTDCAAGPAVMIISSDGKEADINLLVENSEENNICEETVSGQPILSKSTEVKNKKSNKLLSGTSVSSKEKQVSKPKSRVVQSRFRSGLSGPKNNSNSNASNTTCNNLNCTLGGSLSSSSNSSGRNKSIRGPASKLGVCKSMTNVSKTASNTARNANSLASNSRPVKSTTNLAKTQTPGGGRVKANSGPCGSLNLHSTVLAERTVLGSNNVFSTTVVGGHEPGRLKKLVASKQGDTMSTAFPELPDISAIRLDSNTSDKSEDMTIFSAASGKDSSQENSSGSSREVTYEDLTKEYLRYLQSFFIDVVSEDAFDNQLDDLKTQLVFLDQLVNEKQVDLTDRNQKMELLYYHQKVFETHRDQTEHLQKLVDDIPKSEDSLEVLTKELEKNLHQVKMDNLHIPENHKTYRDELSEVLKSQIISLDELENLVEPRSHQLATTISLLDDLQVNTQRIQQYEREVNQAARLAIQEASLQIVAKHEE